MSKEEMTTEGKVQEIAGKLFEHGRNYQATNPSDRKAPLMVYEHHVQDLIDLIIPDTGEWDILRCKPINSESMMLVDKNGELSVWKECSDADR